MKVDLHLLREQLPFKHLELADEWEFGRLFPDCQLGAMAPFGNLYGLSVYVEESLVRQEEIAFSVGTHVNTIRMSLEQKIERVAKEAYGAYSVHLESAARKRLQGIDEEDPITGLD